MDAVGKQDAEAIGQVAEKTFADKIVKEMPALKGKSLRYKKAAGDVDLNSVYLLDKLFLKGVGSERSKNGSNFDYVVITDLEAEGLKQYVHKYNLGHQRYYFLKAFDADILSKLNMDEQKNNQKEFYYRERLMRDAASKQKKEMLEQDFNLILRVTMQLTDGVLGQFAANDSKMSKDYTGNHIAIFECQLKNPPVLSMADHDCESYIMNSRLNFKNWRLVDLDNFMKGNPPYSDFISQITWDKQVDEVSGPKAFKTTEMKSRKEV